MGIAKAGFVAVGLAFLLGCNSLSSPSLHSYTTPTPSIVSFSPSSTPQGSPDILLNIEGINFLPGVFPGDQPAVLWSSDGGVTGPFLEVTHASDTHITAVIPAASLVSAESVTIQVQIHNVAADHPKASSNTVDFTVTD
jgi:hypothetical protein